MAPKEGNSIVKHGVLDERLNVHGVKNLKVADLSICPDNVGCNTYSTALLIGEKCAVLAAEDLGYSGKDLEMKVCLNISRYKPGISNLFGYLGSKLPRSWRTLWSCQPQTLSKNRCGSMKLCQIA